MGLFDFFKKKQEPTNSNSPIAHYTTIVFDVETTGLSPTKDEILQLSMVDEHANILYNEYFKPKFTKNWHEAQKVNGISPKMVAGKTWFDNSIIEIQQLFDSASTIMGYNINFDINFLEAAGIKGLREKKIIDVMNEYSSVFHRTKLSEAAKHFNFNYSAHNALEDAKATLYIHNQLRALPLDTSKKRKKDNKLSKEEYLQQKIGDKTIAELQAEEYEEIVKRNFKPDTPSYEGLHIFSSVYPHQKDYDHLNEGEKRVFKAFAELCKANHLPIDKIRMVHQCSNDFIIDHPDCWAGRFRVKQKAPKYDIYQINSEKRKRVCKTMEEAQALLSELGEGYSIKVRSEEPLCNLTLPTNSNNKFDNITVDELISHLPKIIRYIKKCQQN